MAIQMLIEYIQKLLKRLFECLREEGQLSALFFDDSCLPAERVN